MTGSEGNINMCGWVIRTDWIVWRGFCCSGWNRGIAKFAICRNQTLDHTKIISVTVIRTHIRNKVPRSHEDNLRYGK